jgi:hypothetical protein
MIVCFKLRNALHGTERIDRGGGGMYRKINEIHNKLQILVSTCSAKMWMTFQVYGEMN